MTERGWVFERIAGAFHGEDDRCLHVPLPVTILLEISTKPVTTRATTATRARCVERGLGRETPGARRSSRDAAEDDPRRGILQLNTEGLTANKISIIEQLSCKTKALIIVLQETHRTTADKLVIPNFTLVGSVLSRKHGLATFAHERLEWSLVDQSPEKSETEWLCVDVAGYKIISVYKPPRSRLTPTAIPTFPHPSPVVLNLYMHSYPLTFHQIFSYPLSEIK